MATLRERAAEWSDGWARFLILSVRESPRIRTKRFDRALIRWAIGRGRNQDAAWVELREAAVAIAERDQRAMRKDSYWPAGAVPTTTPEDTLREAGISTQRQARYQRRMSSLLAGRA